MQLDAEKDVCVWSNLLSKVSEHEGTDSVLVLRLGSYLLTTWRFYVMTHINVGGLFLLFFS